MVSALRGQELCNSALYPFPGICEFMLWCHAILYLITKGLWVD